MHKDRGGQETIPGELSHDAPQTDYTPLIPSGVEVRYSRSSSQEAEPGDPMTSRRSGSTTNERVNPRRSEDAVSFNDLEVVVRHLRRQISLVLNSMPANSIDEHYAHHEDYARVIKERKEKEEEDLKLKKELKSKLIKTVSQAVFMAFVVVLGLGVQAQFSKWVNQAVESQASNTMTRGANTPQTNGDKK